MSKNSLVFFDLKFEILADDAVEGYVGTVFRLADCVDCAED
jgi:hypothetical protein